MDFLKTKFEGRQVARMFLDGIIVGIFAGLISVLYRFILASLEKYRYIFFDGSTRAILAILIVFPIFAIIITKLLKWAPLSGGSGIPQIRGEVIGRFDMDENKTIVSKLVGGSLGAFAGLSLGREGPSIQLGGSIGKVMGKILKIGVPIAFQDGLIQIAFIIITIIANQRGLNDAAAVGIVEKVIGFLFLIPSSMLSTVSALGAQNIGAGKPERAFQTLRYAILLTVGFGMLSSIVIQFAAEPIVSLFTDRNAEGGADVIRLGGQYLRGYIWDSIFAGIHFSFSGYFCARGKSGLSFLHNILAIALVRIPGVHLTSQLFPETLFPMGLATAAGSLTSVVICVIAFTVIRRKDRQLALGG